MAHEITASDTMLSTKEEWHNLQQGLTPAEIADPREAIKRAFPWEPQAVQLLRSTVNMELVDGYRLLVRSDNGAQLGMVSDAYQIGHNSLIAKVAHRLADYGCTVETAGSLKGGKIVYISLRDTTIDADILAGDELKGYQLITTRHDGLGSMRMAPTLIRVVCHNTYSRAGRDLQTNATLRWTHKEKFEDDEMRIQQMVDAALNSRKTAQTIVATNKALAAKPLTVAQIQDFFLKVYTAQFGSIHTVEATEAEAKANAKAVDTVRQWTNLIDAPTNSLPGMRGTGWAALNAVTEWTQHHKRTRGDQRHSALVGATAQAVSNVHDLAYDLLLA